MHSYELLTRQQNIASRHPRLSGIGRRNKLNSKKDSGQARMTISVRYLLIWYRCPLHIRKWHHIDFHLKVQKDSAYNITAMEKIKIGISSCLLGNNVRYDGGHKWDRYVTDTLGVYFEWVPVCPEVEFGLPIPREAMHLVGEPAAPRLVTIRTGIDHTDGMLKWADAKLKDLENEELCGFIFRSKSPSSGISGIKVYTPSGIPSHKEPVFSGCIHASFPPYSGHWWREAPWPSIEGNFIERVFVYRRWKDFLKISTSIKDLVAFHTEHKLLILSHSPKHLSALENLLLMQSSKIGKNCSHAIWDFWWRGCSLLPQPKKIRMSSCILQATSEIFCPWW